MNAHDHLDFLLPHNFSAERLRRQVGETNCEIEGSTPFTLTFYDSFDWRLHAAGLRLMQISSAQGSALRLKTADGAELAETDYAGKPAWWMDLPDGDLRDGVAGRLDIRVLLPVVEARCEATVLRVLDDDAKTVVRMQLIKLYCQSGDVDEPRMLLPRVRLLPVRGYASSLEAVKRLLSEELEWPLAPPCLFDEAVAAVGREAGDYSSKFAVALRAERPAVDALRKILLSLLDTLERNLPGTRADLDSEFLHDLRVATRRTRSALTQVKRVLPDDIVETYKARFAWLGQITGPTRDLDVFLLELPRYRASLPAQMAADLDALEQHLRKAHKTEQGRLKRKLGSAEMRSLLADWRGLLEADAFPGQPGEAADLPVGELASKRIWRMYKRVRNDGRAVTADGPPEAMHELRKDCKKLRYLIEFFRDLYPSGDIKKIIKTLKGLLDILGAYQDLEVQAGKLRVFAQQLESKDPANLNTVMAIGALVADLLRHQQQAHDHFAEAFAGFDSQENRALYRRLFRGAAGETA